MKGTHSTKLVLIHITGDRLYPCAVEDELTGEVRFRVTRKGYGNKKDVALQVTEIDMLNYVLNENYNVRCKTLTPTTTTIRKGKEIRVRRTGLYGIKNYSIIDFELIN
ncbi:transposase [Kluyvera sichuanensis]|uniref:transposase n=1 Tax=Kluyvera sichuanensis TaxID=2725494 RepID=UPI0039F661E6